MRQERISIKQPAMNVIVFSDRPYEKERLEASNKGKHNLIYHEEALSVATVDRVKNAEAVAIFANDDCSAPVLDKLKGAGVNYISIRAAGHDQVDLEHAKKLGIATANVPQYSPYAIAEHAVSLMLALNRKLIQSDKKVKDYNFSLDDLIGFDMNGKTAGIIGCGKIGGIVAKILNGFGCKLLVYDVYKNEELIKNYGVEYCSLEKLAAQADIISIHAPLNEHTKHLINKTLIDTMKTGVMLINTGRGAVVDTLAVIDGLKNGKIGYFGMDVYEYEKPLYFNDHSDAILQDDIFARLLTFKNVLVTGHQAFLTDNALVNIADATIANLDSWAKGEKPKFEL